MKQAFLLFILILSFCSVASAQRHSITYLFVGTYTEGKPGHGIYSYSFNTRSGALKEISSVDGLTNPSYLTFSPNGQYLYACADTKMPDTGSVMAFRVDTVSGNLHFLNKQSSGGDNPVYLAVHPGNRFVINANYSGASASVYRVNEDGSLETSAQVITFSGSSIIKDRQEMAHIHSAVFSPLGDYAFFPDLGSDKIWVFRFDTSAVEPLIPMEGYTINALPGSGPRHFTFHPNGRFAYSIEELSGMVSAYAYSDGMLDSLQRIFSFSGIWDTYWSADIHISPDGHFLYASNRGKEENTISIFSIDQQSGILRLVGHQFTYGDHPRNFAIDPTGKFLLVANMWSNTIVVFKRNKNTGLLKKTEMEIAVQAPSCLQMRTYGKGQGANDSDKSN